METEKEREMWRLAKKRAGFKKHLMMYLVVHVFFWLLWLFKIEDFEIYNNIPWPLFSMLGWGVGLAFEYMNAYVYPKNSSIEKEYEKLKSKDN